MTPDLDAMILKIRRRACLKPGPGQIAARGSRLIRRWKKRLQALKLSSEDQNSPLQPQGGALTQGGAIPLDPPGAGLIGAGECFSINAFEKRKDRGFWPGRARVKAGGLNKTKETKK